MDNGASTPPPKGPRAKQQSATPGNTNATNATPAKHNNRQKNHKNRQEQNYHSDAQGLESQTDAESQRRGHVTDDGVGGQVNGNKSKRKPRPQNPRNRQNGQDTTGSPPHNRSANMAMATPDPPKVAAYAGPTFHASPAPTTLPKPKFFSKSVPADAAEGGLQARLNAEQSINPPPSLAADAPAVPPRNEESPLDFLFQSDRAEKAKRNSSLATPQGKLERHSSYGSPDNGEYRGNHNRNASGGLFPIELDGSGSVQRPSLHPHSNENNQTHRSVTAPTTSPRTRSHPQDQDSVTQSLKAKLFALPQQENAPSPYNATPPNNRSSPSDFYSPSPFNRPGVGSRSSSGPTTPAPLNGNGNGPQQSHHYGNKNLSPLFKASQGKVNSRPSALRQEVASPQQPHFQGHANAHHPGPASPNHFGPPLQNAPVGPKEYMNSHYLGADSMPNLPLRSPGFENGQSGSHRPMHNTGLPSNGGQHYHGYQGPYAPRATNGHSFPVRGQQDAVPAPSSADVKDMENRLRQMLKLGGNGQ